MPDHLLLDVFTDRPCTGSRVAVAVDPGELDMATMQAIAGELNMSERPCSCGPRQIHLAP